jgi:DNA-binding HxlR family transcriptional regulator
MKQHYSPSSFQNLMSLTELIGDKHAVRILYELLLFGPKQFNELKRMIDCNAVTLTKKLRHLETQGLIHGEHIGYAVQYRTTDKATPFRPLMNELESLASNITIKEG